MLGSRRKQIGKADLFRRGRFFYALILCLAPGLSLAAGIDQVRQWRHNGAYELALQALNEQAPDAAQDYPAWQRWAWQRFGLYRDLGLWDSIIQQYEQLPSSTQGSFRQWAEIQAVHAYLRLRETDTALSLAQKRLWAKGDWQTLQLWRAVLIQIYAASGDSQAAMTAWRRFARDGAQDSADMSGELLATEQAAARRVYARELIRRERYTQAVSELSGQDDVDGRLLYGAAQLLVDAETAGEVYGMAAQLAETDGVTPGQRRRALVLKARAAARQKRYADRIDALVGALLIPNGDNAPDSLFAIDADSLWAAYEEWGHSLGLAAGLRITYEGEWASALQRSRPASERVALASVLLLNGRSEQSREAAAGALLMALPQLSWGRQQTLWLLNESERLRGNFINLPADLQRAALRAALHEGQQDTVRHLIQSTGPINDPLNNQADGVLYVHARLLLGEPAPATRFLSEGLDNLSAWFPRTQRDLLVLLRDLQGTGYHSPVALAGEKMVQRSSERDLRLQAAEYASRSMIALQQYRPAARLALSVLAQSPDAERHDLALLAYEALWRAGLRADAEQIWHRKLSAPEVQSEAADLKRRLQLPETEP